MYVLYNNQFICKKNDTNELVPCLSLSEDLTHKINEIPVIAENTMDNIIPIQTYPLDNCELLWIFDNDNHNAAGIKSNNLLIVKQDSSGSMQLIWNMKETVSHDDCCVSVNLEDGQTFSFTTFNGKRFTIKTDTDKTELIDNCISK